LNVISKSFKKNQTPRPLSLPYLSLFLFNPAHSTFHSVAWPVSSYSPAAISGRGPLSLLSFIFSISAYKPAHLSLSYLSLPDGVAPHVISLLSTASDLNPYAAAQRQRSSASRVAVRLLSLPLQRRRTAFP
jgi:hypothetical protein